MKIGNVPVEPGIYPNFCADPPKKGKICGKKINAGQWKHKFDYYRVAVYYHEERKIYRFLISAGPFFIVAETNKINTSTQLYLDTLYDSYKEIQKIEGTQYFKVVYPTLPEKSAIDIVKFSHIVYDGYKLYINDRYKILARDLGEILEYNDKEIKFSHGKVYITDTPKRIVVEWHHKPPEKSPKTKNAEVVYYW